MAMVPGGLLGGALQAYASNPFSTVPGLLAAAGAGHASGKMIKYGYGRAKRYLRGGRLVPYRPRGRLKRYSRKQSYRSAKKRGRRNFKRRKFKKSAKSQCRSIAKQLNADTGHLTYRKRSTSQFSVVANAQATLGFTMNSIGEIESDPCTQLYYYDPSTPGTLLNPDYTSGTYSRDLNVQSSGVQVTFKNNTTGVANLRVYWCTPNADTSITPEVYWDNICADNPTTITKETIGTSPNDLRTPLWNYQKVKSCRLEPGKSCMVKKFLSQFQYKPALSDVHALFYQRKYKAGFFMAVLVGDIAHDDTTTANIGRSSATLDCEIKKFWKVQYAAGVNIRYTYDSNAFDTMAAGATIAQKPPPVITTVDK